ncbi:RecQ family ATP-dependent DNA helicase [Alkalicoccobacillus murimartini]|uniref:ATP-dependent DNA helicase RecQ n=1 Tax=Alkalicoccobacillus murimartini TaxID=171685 RepID=A0ABT9YEA4_9BACI|nr:ATP-dependent DNA helicase RecQ [Alkalicoccobacillus murimartini]MDQ0205876.1 ATP-dependent DNA helicase RecQ [Alkalicoccobacillus murimartini]
MELHESLKKWFGYSEFRPGQREIIESLVSGQDVLAMLPTGTGKSICYQLPALLSDGLTIVVSPLLSLMLDQVQELKSKGMKQVAALNSMISKEERQSVLTHLSHYRLLYVSPEMLQSDWVLSKLKQINVRYFVVDEAHCISHWGKSFRTDYRKLAPIKRYLGHPPCLAITATATEEVRKDIKEQLQLQDESSYIYSVDRKNIALHIQETDSKETKLEQLLDYVNTVKGPGIVYFQSRKWTESAAEYLRSQGHTNVSFYHGGMVQEDRLLIQQQFMNGQLNLICCTSAFGMGLNKSDIRYVIHFHLPLDLESYLQEIGRAGRDGNQSLAILLYNKDDLGLATSMIQRDVMRSDQLVHILTALSEGGAFSPEKEVSIYTSIGVSESAFSILRYQLEQQQFVHRGNWKSFDVETVYSQMDHMLVEYRKVVERRLSNVYQWVETSQCKRERILHYFGEPAVEKPKLCCSSCGISVSDFELIQQNEDRVLGSVTDWQNQLNRVFLKEVGNGN